LHYEIIEAPKKFQDPDASLRPRSVNFFNLSHETVSLKEEEEMLEEDVKDVLIWSPQPQPPLGPEEEATHPPGYNSIPTAPTIPTSMSK
jgi:hypothetical protein